MKRRGRIQSIWKKRERNILSTRNYSCLMKLPFHSTNPKSPYSLPQSPLPLYSEIVQRPENQMFGFDSSNQRDVLILHGLFATGSSWKPIAQKINQKTRNPLKFHLIDMRNHGNSPHSPSMTYQEMVQDVLYYMERHSLKQVSFIGHSFGGKVAMQMALQHPELVQQLVVVDIAPVVYSSNTPFQNYIDYMQSIDLKRIKTKKEADDHLRPYIPNYSLRQFLLSNLIKSQNFGTNFQWRAGFSGISNSLSSIRETPWEYTRRFLQPTLFIGGKESDYIQEQHHSAIQHFFPKNQILKIEGAHHWVQTEKPQEFLQAVLNYFDSS